MAALKEMFVLWIQDVLELFNSILEPKVITEGKQVPLKIIKLDLKVDLKLY